MHPAITRYTTCKLHASTLPVKSKCPAMAPCRSRCPLASLFSGAGGAPQQSLLPAPRASHRPARRDPAAPRSHELVAGARTASSATATRLGHRPRSLSPAGRATGRGPRRVAVDLPGTREDGGWVGGRGRWRRLNRAPHGMRGETLPRPPQLRRVRGHQVVAVQHAAREGRA